MTTKDAPVELTLQVRCRNLPPTLHAGEPTEFGLQDKQHQLDVGQADTDGAQCFTIALAVQARGTTDAPDFAGTAVHRRPGERFLSLGWRGVGAPS